MLLYSPTVYIFVLGSSISVNIQNNYFAIYLLSISFLFKVWNIISGHCLHTLQGSNKHQSAVTSLQFTDDFIITSSDDGTVKLWDLNTGEFIRDLVALDTGGSGKDPYYREMCTLLIFHLPQVEWYGE